ncbi:MAG: hypothetical protein QMB59_05210, partial [Bacteroidales bacterium]
VPEDAVVQVNSKKLEKHVTSSVTSALEGAGEMRLYATRLTTEAISFQEVTSSGRLFYYPCSEIVTHAYSAYKHNMTIAIYCIEIKRGS